MFDNRMLEEQVQPIMQPREQQAYDEACPGWLQLQLAQEGLQQQYRLYHYGRAPNCLPEVLQHAFPTRFDSQQAVRDAVIASMEVG